MLKRLILHKQNIDDKSISHYEKVNIKINFMYKL